ncbi:hypothetical protein WDW86_13900 [Bdellovibrionota bacterium FG-2]
MLLWLLFLTLQFNPSRPAFAGQPSVGSSSREEGELLWNAGKAAFDKKDFQGVVNQLDRFVARYPGFPYYLEAHLILGEALLKLNRSKQAIRPLKYFVSAVEKGEDALSSRLLLAQAYLNTEKYNEALLLTNEVEALSNKGTPLSETLQLKMLVSRAQALMRLSQEAKAQGALASAKNLPSAAQNSEYEWTALEFATRKCGFLADTRKFKVMNEEVLLDQLERRGQCISEATVLYTQLFSRETRSELEIPTRLLRNSFNAYWRVCTSPPSPPAIAPKDRTPEELQRYKVELRDRLVQLCQGRGRQILDLLEKFRAQTTPDMTSDKHDFIRSLTDDIRFKTDPPKKVLKQPKKARK